MDLSQLIDIWFVLIASILAGYLILDGYDTGVGIFVLLERDEKRRGQMIESIAGLWQPNQTWLVILGGLLFAVFPRAYGAVLSSLYLPVIAMLLALAARGLSLEYREEVEDAARCSRIFGLGSLAIGATQGMILGAVLQGLPLGGGLTAGILDWFGPGALFGALALVAAQAVLGGAWMRPRVSRAVWESIKRPLAGFAAASLIFQVGLLAVLVVTSAEGYFARQAASGAAIACAAAAFALYAVFLFRLRASAHGLFLSAAGYVLASLAAWGIAAYPMALPPHLTLSQAAASSNALRVMLAVFAVVLPVIIGYNAYVYRVFGKPEHIRAVGGED